MVVLLFPFDLVVVVFLGKVPLLYQIQLLEQVEGAIDRRKADTRFPFLGQAVKLLGI